MLIFEILGISIITFKIIKYTPFLYKIYYKNENIEYAGSLIILDTFEHFLIMLLFFKYHSMKLIGISLISIINLFLITIKKYPEYFCCVKELNVKKRIRKRRKRRKRKKRKFRCFY